MEESLPGYPRWLRQWFEQHTIDLWGVGNLADFTTPPDDAGRPFPRAFAWVLPMNPQIMGGIKDGPTREYADDYSRVNKRINEQAAALTQELRSRGFQARPLAASERTDKDNIKGDFPHKTAATRAGIGWVGRHCQLVTRPYGSWVRLGTVFTDMDLVCGKPLQRHYCGRCHLCVETCPAKALQGNGWYPGIDREKLVNVKQCDKWKKTHYYQYHRGHNCGICSAVCPYGTRLLRQPENKKGGK